MTAELVDSVALRENLKCSAVFQPVLLPLSTLYKALACHAATEGNDLLELGLKCLKRCTAALSEIVNAKVRTTGLRFMSRAFIAS